MKLERFVAGILAKVDGVEFYATGKRGTNIATGKAVEAYDAGDDSGRVWITANGEVFAD